MMSYRSLIVIPLMILLGCKDYALKEPFRSPNGLYGFKDGEGKIRIEAKYDRADSFSEGLAKVELNGKWGFVNLRGKEVVPPKYDDVENFDQGFARVRFTGKFGYVDLTGREVVLPKYDDARQFRSPGSSLPAFREGLVPVGLNGKWGFVNTKGNVVISLKYDYAYNFDEGLAIVEFGEPWNILGVGVKSTNGFIDTQGREYWNMTEDQARQKMKNR